MASVFVLQYFRNKACYKPKQVITDMAKRKYVVKKQTLCLHFEFPLLENMRLNGYLKHCFLFAVLINEYKTKYQFRKSSKDTIVWHVFIYS